MTWMRSAAALPLLLVLLTGCTPSPPDPTRSPSASAAPVDPSPPASAAPAPSAPDATVAAGIDTSTWTAFTSARYGVGISHPPDWIVMPSERSWTLEEDAGVWDSTAQDGFMGDQGDIWVTLWAAPYDGPSTLAGVQTWTEQYCHRAGGSNCATLGERAVRLCNGRQVCHPGLLVPFREDVQAFFTGGQHTGRIIAVASWRPPAYHVVDSGTSGTSREVLDAFLSTMDVWPQP